MKLIKKILLSSLTLATAITLSSCSILDFLKSEAQNAISEAESKSIEESKNKESDPTTPSTNVEESITQPDDSSKADEEIIPIIIDELDYGYLDIEKIGSTKEKIEDMQLFYKDVKRKLEEFSKSDINVTSQTVAITYSDPNTGIKTTVDEDYYFIGDVFYTDYDINATEALVVVKEVFLDYPEYYFVDNKALTFSSEKTKGSTTEYTYSIRLTVDEDYKLASKRKEYNQKIEEYRTTIENLFTLEDTDSDKVKKIHDYIVNNAKYAYETDGVTPKTSSFAHNMLGIILNKEGVCESYTELFTYLLKSFDIPAITVSGEGFSKKNKSGEPHAWNYVYLNNNYYMFDVTWDDSTNSYDYYGLSEANANNMNKIAGNIIFIDDKLGGHKPAESRLDDRLNYLYSLPQLSDKNLVTTN